MKILLILPAYNEEKNIKKAVDSIIAYSSKYTNVMIDYIVINDGSTDLTQSVCEENNIKCISLIQNLGIGGAVQTGYKYAKIKGYDVAVQFDGDGQHDIESLMTLISPILNDSADFVIGSRFIEGTSEFKSTMTRRVGIKYLSFLIQTLTLKKVYDPTSGFRAANKKAINYLAEDYPVDYPEPESIVTLLKNGLVLKEVQVNMFEREGGVSSISPMKSVYYMIKVSLAILCASFQRKVSV
ncbi:MAG: glycosyltransferase family 2 protein [Clostridium sp.]